MTQTAVEWLDEKLNTIRLDVDRNVINFIDLSIQKAKEIENQQLAQTIDEVFEWLTTHNYLTDLKETMIKDFNKFKNK